MRTMEQRQEIDELVKQVEELEEVRKRQARKIGALKNEHSSYESSSREKNVVADNAVQALSSELRTTKNSLQTTHNREKQVSVILTSIFLRIPYSQHTNREKQVKVITPIYYDILRTTVIIPGILSMLNF